MPPASQRAAPSLGSVTGPGSEVHRLRERWQEEAENEIFIMPWRSSHRVRMCAVFCLSSQARVRWVLQRTTLSTASLWDYMPRFKTKQNKKAKLEAGYQPELFPFFLSKCQMKMFLKLLSVSILNIYGHTYLALSYSL